MTTGDSTPPRAGTLGSYLMESAQEAERLDRKTDPQAVRSQASFGGLKAGMRVADLGCGSGKTTSELAAMAGSNGSALGIDIARNRIDFAVEHYRSSNCDFELFDIREDSVRKAEFDFVWIRFVLEYYLDGAFDIVRKASELLRPGGVMCLVDLDNNCLNHHEIPPRLEKTLKDLVEALQSKVGFDPFAGRKLYSHLYDLGFQNIQVRVEGHHVIYGALKASDEFNWLRKVEIAPRRAGFQFSEYQDGHEGFRAEFEGFFNDPRRFTYSPLVVCAGTKPG